MSPLRGWTEQGKVSPDGGMAAGHGDGAVKRPCVPLGFQRACLSFPVRVDGPLFPPASSPGTGPALGDSFQPLVLVVFIFEHLWRCLVLTLAAVRGPFAPFPLQCLCMNKAPSLEQFGPFQQPFMLLSIF